jgi:uncharacterized protein
MATPGGQTTVIFLEFDMENTKRFSVQEKKDRLIRILEGFDSLLVAFSGGVDSTFLIATAREVLGERLIAVTAQSPVHSRRETEAAKAFATKLGVRHAFLSSREMWLDDFVVNRRDRCYVCKKALFEDLLELAVQLRIQCVAHGANLDDLKDFRPGFAAARELNIQAPLVDANMTKTDIRNLSKEMKLPTWDKPSSACLATRIPYGIAITVDVLDMIDRAESYLLKLGFRGCRVRHHGLIARIELERVDFQKMLDEGLRERVVKRMRQIGFSYVAMDLDGYNQGSMNRMLQERH